MGRENATTGNGQPPPANALTALWQRVVVEPMRQIDADSRRFLASPAARTVDWKTAIVLTTAAVSLTLQYYLADTQGFGTIARVLAQIGFPAASETLFDAIRDPVSGPANKLTCWAAGAIVTYTALPLLAISCVFRERVRDYGVKVKGAFTGFWIYGLMLVVMAPLIFLASQSSSFQQTYPFYDVHAGEPLGPRFWRWEMLYALQFFALEFFFRGFLLHGTRHRFGCYSIFVMMVPYCMIHFGKPMPEALAAIVAGIVLGFMSLKTRSIWLGAAIHVTVAWSMDFASLWRKGILG